MNSVQNDFLNKMCSYCQRFDLLDMINDALLLIDSADGAIVFMNQKALDLYQYTREEISALSLFSVSHAAASDVSAYMKIAKQYANGYINISRHVNKYGKIMKVQTNTREINFHGQRLFASIVRDLQLEENFREEIESLGKVQRRLLPRNISNHLFQMNTFYHPCNHASGDLYDFNFDNEKNIMQGVLIDVMGHGASAVAQTSLFKYLFLQAIEKSIPINNKLEWINKEVFPFFHEENFAAVLFFEFNFTTNTLKYSAGGINHFTYISMKGIQDIKCAGLFLGINKNESFDEHTIPFKTGDSFFFLTDGFDGCNLQDLHGMPNYSEVNNFLKSHTKMVHCRDDASGVGILIA